jgi:hypothetical protein
MRGGGLIEVGAGDRIAVLERVLAQHAGDVEKYPAADHPRFGLLDPALLRAGRRHLAAVEAVPHVALIEYVTEPIPLGAALQRHDHHVIGGANAALVEHARIGIGSGAQHDVDGIDAAHGGIFAFGALRPMLVEIERQRDHLALAHQSGRRDDVFGLRVIQGADFIRRAPFTPVLELLGGIAKVLSANLPARHGGSLSVGGLFWSGRLSGGPAIAR